MASHTIGSPTLFSYSCSCGRKFQPKVTASAPNMEIAAQKAWRSAKRHAAKENGR